MPKKLKKTRKTKTKRKANAARKKTRKAAWLGWHFCDDSEALRYGDGRLIKVGATHKVECEPVLCQSGLHASPTVLDALAYAPSAILHRVSLSGKIVHGDDKSCATERTYIARIDATPVLREFARKCALSVIHLWDCPRIVREYLETGDETKRAAAWDAARAAAGAAAWDAQKELLDKMILAALKKQEKKNARS